MQTSEKLNLVYIYLSNIDSDLFFINIVEYFKIKPFFDKARGEILDLLNLNNSPKKNIDIVGSSYRYRTLSEYFYRRYSYLTYYLSRGMKNSMLAEKKLLRIQELENLINELAEKDILGKNLKYIIEYLYSYAKNIFRNL